MREDTFLDSRNKYLGTLILVMILAFIIREFMPPVVDSLKKEKVRFPANR